MSAVTSTSLAAYRTLDLPDLERKVLEIIESFGAFGCTVDEIIWAHPDIEYRTLSPRFAPLERKGLIFRAGDTRRGHSTRQQKVMRGITHLATTPKVVAKKSKNPFLAGMLFAAKAIVGADPSFKGSPGAIALKAEIRKVATK